VRSNYYSNQSFNCDFVFYFRMCQRPNTHVFTPFCKLYKRITVLKYLEQFYNKIKTYKRIYTLRIYTKRIYTVKSISYRLVVMFFKQNSFTIPPRYGVYVFCLCAKNTKHRIIIRYVRLFFCNFTKMWYSCNRLPHIKSRYSRWTANFSGSYILLTKYWRLFIF